MIHSHDKNYSFSKSKAKLGNISGRTSDEIIKKNCYPVPFLSYTSLHEEKRMDHSSFQELLTIFKDIMISVKVFNVKF